MITLKFNPPINTSEELGFLYEALHKFNPAISWSNGQSLESFNPLNLLSISERIENLKSELIYLRRSKIKDQRIGLAFGSSEFAYQMATGRRFSQSNTFYI